MREAWEWCLSLEKDGDSKTYFSFFPDTLEGNRMSQAKFARLIALMRPLLKKRNGHPPTKKEEKLETPPTPTLPFPSPLGV